MPGTRFPIKPHERRGGVSVPRFQPFFAPRWQACSKSPFKVSSPAATMTRWKLRLVLLLPLVAVGPAAYAFIPSKSSLPRRCQAPVCPRSRGAEDLSPAQRPWQRGTGAVRSSMLAKKFDKKYDDAFDDFRTSGRYSLFSCNNPSDSNAGRLLSVVDCMHNLPFPACRTFRASASSTQTQHRTRGRRALTWKATKRRLASDSRRCSY